MNDRKKKVHRLIFKLMMQHLTVIQALCKDIYGSMVLLCIGNLVNFNRLLVPTLTRNILLTLSTRQITYIQEDAGQHFRFMR